MPVINKFQFDKKLCAGKLGSTCEVLPGMLATASTHVDGIDKLRCRLNAISTTVAIVPTLQAFHGAHNDFAIGRNASPQVVPAQFSGDAHNTCRPFQLDREIVSHSGMGELETHSKPSHKKGILDPKAGAVRPCSC